MNKPEMKVGAAHHFDGGHTITIRVTFPSGSTVEEAFEFISKVRALLNLEEETSNVHSA